jgi:hypothetical protein
VSLCLSRVAIFFSIVYEYESAGGEKITCDGRARDGERPLPLLIVLLRRSADVLLLLAPATPDDDMAAAAALGFRKWSRNDKMHKSRNLENNGVKSQSISENVIEGELLKIEWQDMF